MKGPRKRRESLVAWMLRERRGRPAVRRTIAVERSADAEPSSAAPAKRAAKRAPSTSDLRDAEEFRALTPGFESAEGIYSEGGWLCHVRVSRIKITRRGLRATITRLSSPGMAREDLTSWKVGAAWSYLDFSEHRWLCPYGFEIEFDPDTVRAVVDEAARTRDEPWDASGVTRLMRFVRVMRQGQRALRGRRG